VAAARAATRLGSKTKIFPPPLQHQRFPSREHIIAKGSAVVFPAPGGACKIKSLFSFSKRTRKQSSTTSLIGSCDICSRTDSFSKSFPSFSHFPFPIGGSGVVKLLLLLLLLVERVKNVLFLLRCVFPLAKATLCLLSFLISLVKRLSET
jgi:hypothetical protein